MSSRWPALMDPQTAAEYLSVGKRTLERMAAGPNFPSPVKRTAGGAGIGWRQTDLDHYIDSLPRADTKAQLDKRNPRNKGKK